MSAQEVILEAALALTEARSEPGDRDQISGDGGQVEKAHRKADDSTACALRNGRLLHGHAMQRSQAQHQVSAVNAGNLAIGKKRRQHI